MTRQGGSPDALNFGALFPVGVVADLMRGNCAAFLGLA